MAKDLENSSESSGLMLADNTNKLTNAVSSLPELLEKKRLLDMHTNIATSLLEQIKVNLKVNVIFVWLSKTTNCLCRNENWTFILKLKKKFWAKQTW